MKIIKTNEIGPRTGSVSILAPHQDFKSCIKTSSQLTRAIELNIETWFTCTEDFGPKDLSRMIKTVRQSIFNHIQFNKLFNTERTIVISEVNKLGIKAGKSTYLEINVTLFITEERYCKDSQLIEEIELIKDIIIKTMERHPNMMYSKCKV